MRKIAGWGVACFAWLCVVLAARSAWANELTHFSNSAPSLDQRAYIWQRVWTPALRASIANHGSAFSAFDVLVAEIRFTSTAPEIALVQPDWTVLRATQRSIGLVVRVGAMREKTTAQTAKSIDTVIATCAQAWARARAAGIEPAELQIDFDAPTRELAAYREWLHRLRGELHPPRVVITALPAWLSRPEFLLLTREIDGYVLQVHSVEKPVLGSEALVLCDPANARHWIRQANTLGCPFRVALPTYGYRVGFRRDGSFIGLEAEGSERTWPAGTSFQIVTADHRALATLVHELQAKPPSHFGGLSWFRLPTDDDDLTWPWSTLDAVMHGEVPREHLAVRTESAGPGLFDLEIENDGAAPAAPASIDLTWQGAILLAADGLDGWRVKRGTEGHVTLIPSNEGRAGTSLTPGEKRPVGWLRFSAPVKIEFIFHTR